MKDVLGMRALDTLDNSLAVANESPAGSLDGVTILRYAHIERDRASGGVEQYLRHLHRGLLQKHRLTVLQMHLAKNSAASTIEEEEVGIGRIVWMPVPVLASGWPIADIPRRVGCILRQVRDERENGQGRVSAVSVLREYGCHLRHRSAVLSNHLARALTDYRVDLLVMHWLNYDSDFLLRRAVGIGIPFAVVNHFANSRLGLARNQKWLGQAAGIGTVSSRGIPAGLKDACTSLSDAVDIDFFSPDKVRKTSRSDAPMILLPARIDTGKGHDDLLEIARILIASGAKFSICFAGAIESESLYGRLRQRIKALGLQEQTMFLGEKSAEEIRALYAACSVVVLPSHSEGLGRVLLEAQAMKKPVVAYDCGGVSEAIIPGETGLLVKRGDFSDFAEKVGFFLGSESERLAYGERGRAFVCKQFSIPGLVLRHEKFYLQAMARHTNIRRRDLSQPLTGNAEE